MKRLGLYLAVPAVAVAFLAAACAPATYPPAVAQEPDAGCYQVAGGFAPDLSYTGPLNTLGNSEAFVASGDGTCTDFGPGTVFPNIIITALTQPEAQAICDANNPPLDPSVAVSLDGVTVPAISADAWACQPL
jgi:hypothetical protein